MKKVIPFLVVCIMLLNGCELINPAEDIPAYLKIDSIVLNSTSDQGSNSHKITDVWISIDGELLGTYQIPARIPVLELGTQQIDIFAGIKANGSNGTSDLYPFYGRYQSTVEFVSQEEVELTPTFTYSDDAVFRIVENFEGLNHLLSSEMDGDSETDFGLVADGFEGVGARALLTSTNSFVQSGSDLITEFPPVANGYISYVELNYKTDVVLALGLIGYDLSGNIVFDDFNQLRPTFKGVNPSDEWKKIYFDFSSSFQSCAQAPNVTGYRMVLIAQGDGVNEAEIFIDNFKFVHF